MPGSPRPAVSVAILAIVLILTIGLAGFAFLVGDDENEPEYDPVVPIVAAEEVATTTSPPDVTTTTSTTTTTTTTLPPEPVVTVSLSGAPEGLTDAVTALYRAAVIPAGPATDLVPAALIEHVLPDDAGNDELVEGEAAIALLPDRGEVAVVAAGDDVVLAVNDAGSGWRIVGARLSRFDRAPWYGAPVRMVLVVGSDARPGQNQQRQRADSIHVLAAVPDQAAGTILGFPRDSWVDTPYGKKDKFTHTLAGRGPEVTLETARTLTGLPIEGYFVTGFLGFENLVDAFGGVTVDIPFGMSDAASGAFFSAGIKLLGGADALAFSRNRHLRGGDFTRSFHQGVVMHAALSAISESGATAIPDLLAMLLEHVWTDLDAEALLTLAATAIELDPESVTNLVVPADVGTVGRASVVFIDDEAELIYRDLEDGVLEVPPDD